MDPSVDLLKELTRKLYWAVSSTIKDLSKEDRASSFRWAARAAERILDARHPSLPPSVDRRRPKRYDGQAEGRGGGRKDSSIPEGRGPTPPRDLTAFTERQAAFRRRAWAHVLGGRSAEYQLPIPAEVYREVGNGSTHSVG